MLSREVISGVCSGVAIMGVKNYSAVVTAGEEGKEGDEPIIITI
jgi:hypothetical protein